MSLVHACTIADDVAVEDDVVVLDGAEVESHTIIAKGSIVFPRARLESGLWAGLPARRVRALEPGEAEAAMRRIRAQSCAEQAGLPAGIDGRARLADCLFVAPTARIAGAVGAGEAVSIWFGCEIDAQPSTITIGGSFEHPGQYAKSPALRGRLRSAAIASSATMSGWRAARSATGR